LVFGKGSLISGLRSLELTVLDAQMDFQNGELSLDGDLVESFFLGFIFINDRDSLQKVELVKAEDFVSEDFGNLASTLSGVSGGLENDEVLLAFALGVTLDEGGGVGNVFADSGFRLNSDFVFGGFISGLLDLIVLVSGSGVFMRHDLLNK